MTAFRHDDDDDAHTTQDRPCVYVHLANGAMILVRKVRAANEGANVRGSKYEVRGMLAS